LLFCPVWPWQWSSYLCTVCTIMPGLVRWDGVVRNTLGIVEYRFRNEDTSWKATWQSKVLLLQKGVLLTRSAANKHVEWKICPAFISSASLPSPWLHRFQVYNLCHWLIWKGGTWGKGPWGRENKYLLKW
jgi:hypothetical protein